MVSTTLSSVAGSSDGSSTSDLAVVVDGLVKRYADREVVRDLSFVVRRGEVFALLGPNGAGKTTTIEILEGFRVQDDGRVVVLGEDPASSRTLKQRVGMMPQQSALYPQITVHEALTLFCAYYRDGASPEALLDLVGLRDRAADRFKTLSGGERQRLSLGLAMAGNPELIFLDEPTAAMDPRARQTTWDLISDLRAGGVTIVLTTHYLEEANRLADRVAIIDHGRLVGLGAPSELTQHAGGAVRFFAAPAPAAEALLTLPGVTAAQEERPGFFRLDSVDPDELLIEVAVWSRANRVRVRDLRIERATLEEVFLQLTEEAAP